MQGQSRSFNRRRFTLASLAKPRVRRALEPSAIGARRVALGLTLLLFACTKVDVTPLGSTHDGRRQYELTCNQRATDEGTCNDKAVALCDGSYETQLVGSTAPGVNSYNGQVFTTPGSRVLLIACNR